jgi:hypothetical protein
MYDSYLASISFHDLVFVLYIDNKVSPIRRRRRRRRRSKTRRASRKFVIQYGQFLVTRKAHLI